MEEEQTGERKSFSDSEQRSNGREEVHPEQSNRFSFWNLIGNSGKILRQRPSSHAFVPSSKNSLKSLRGIFRRFVVVGRRCGWMDRICSWVDLWESYALFSAAYLRVSSPSPSTYHPFFSLTFREILRTKGKGIPRRRKESRSGSWKIQGIMAKGV